MSAPPALIDSHCHVAEAEFDADREAVRAIPADRLLVETDAPFLAPVPHRGKRNEPQHVRGVAEAVAAIRGEAFETVAAVTTANACRLLGLGHETT